jgi:hypothetical protein
MGFFGGTSSNRPKKFLYIKGMKMQNNNPTFAAISNEMAHRKQVQAVKYQEYYTVYAVVLAGQTLPVTLTLDEQYDFELEAITGKLFGPTDSEGLYDPAAGTDFPIIGQTGAGPTFCGAGLGIEIVDGSSSRRLTNGYVEASTLLAPGYGTSLFAPMSAKYFFKASSLISFSFRNRDTQANQSIELVLHGKNINKNLGN